MTRVFTDCDTGHAEYFKANISRRTTLQSKVRLVIELQERQANARDMAKIPYI